MTHEEFAHAWPGEEVNPGGVRSYQLRWAWGYPVRETVVGFEGGQDMPAH